MWLKQKIQKENGVSRIVVILMVLIGIMLILISIPVYQYYRNRAEELGCASALNTANHQLSIAYLSDGTFTKEKAKEMVIIAMDGWDDLCPGGGTPYIVENDSDEVPWHVVCGKHERDTRERTRLNAACVLEQIEKQVYSAQIQGELYPQSVRVTVNSKEYEALLTDEERNFEHGAAAMSGVESMVIYYALVGHSEFGSDSGLQPGEVWYFSYADENHCATWSSRDGWN